MNFNKLIIHRGVALGGMLGIALLAFQGESALAQQQHGLPLVNAADASQQSFVRVINRSDRAGTVRIGAIDDAGKRFGPITLSMDAKGTANFNSTELEDGNASKGLSGGVGDGEGNWRLELTTELDIEPLAYIRTSEGFVTSVHDVVQAELVRGDGPASTDSIRHHVPMFNPGKNDQQQSLLRLINSASIDNPVTITGLDDDGEPPPGGEVRLTLPPHSARTISAQQLEQG